MPLAYFEGKTILITGGAQGLGRTLVRKLAPVAGRVICLDRDESASAGFHEEFQDRMNVSWISADVRNLRDVGAAVEQALRGGGIDIVIANAGMTGVVSALDPEITRHREIFETNYFGALHLISAVLPHFLQRQSGQVVAISTIGVFRGVAKAGPYFASKSALTVYLESLRLEAKSRGIRVTTVHPGFIQTKMATGELLRHSFVLSAEKASEIILDGIVRGETDLSFPLPMRIATFFNRLLPDFLFDWVNRKMSKGLG